MVPTVGLEPTRPFGPQILSLRSLPIPSRRHIKKRVATNPHLPAAAHSPSSWWPPHRVRSSSLHILYFSDSSYGGQGGTRTRTPAKAPDFESGTSTNSITRPYGGFLEAPRNLSLKRISRACTPLSAASLDNSHFRLGRCHHITRVFLAPHSRPFVPPGVHLPVCFWLTHNPHGFHLEPQLQSKFKAKRVDKTPQMTI